MKKPSTRCNCRHAVSVCFLLLLLPAFVQAQAPANDDCSSPQTINSDATCITTSGTLYNATPSTGLPGATCGTSASADVWYQFTAHTTNPRVTVAATGASLVTAGIRVQVFSLPSGTCPASFTLIGACSSAIINLTNLSINNTYYIRVLNNTGTGYTAGSAALWGFTVCVLDVAATANNTCGSATTLIPGPTCTNTGGTLFLSTTDGTSTACGTPNGDVWYKFAANTTNPTISLSNIGSAITNPGMELLTGCTGTSLACGTTSITASGLVSGTTYYVRVFTTGAVPSNSPDAGFSICVTDPLPTNDICTNAITLNSALVPVNQPGTLKNADASGDAIACGAGNTASADVYYRFQAKTTNPTIKMVNVGSNLKTANAFVQLLSGSCGSFTSVSCLNSGSTSWNYALTGLSIGTYYYIRVASNNNSAATAGTSWNFEINVTDAAPSNNNCGGATPLIPALSCTPVTGIMYGATNDGASTTCGISLYDVWYSFVAQTAMPTITLSNVGADIVSPGLELYSTCGTSLNICGTTSGGVTTINTTLTPGSTYRIRVFATGGAVPSSGVNGTFDICVTDALPSNDDCSNATLLTSATTCTPLWGNLKNATASTLADDVPAGCGDPAAADVWYKFVAQSSYPNITLGSIGGSITDNTTPLGGGIRMQILDGTCGAFNQVYCATGSYNTSSFQYGQTLIVGHTYYLRISTQYAVAGTPGAGSLWRFTICITDPVNSPTPRFGNSYVNLSKRNSGGVIETGDTLEIRMTISLPAGVVYAPRYVDNVPANTQMLTGTTDSIRIVTNEGLTYKHYTLGAGDDAATYNASPGAGEYNIRMNFGFGASMPAPGAPLDNSESDITGAQQMSSTSRPIGGGKLLFATSFRVKVTGNPGDVITLGSGKFLYRTSPSGADLSVNTIPYKMLVSNALSLCANATGVNSAQEFGGTFGTGTTLNRTTPLAFLPTGYSYVSNVNATTAVGDGSYAIVKNTSPRSGTNRNASRQPNCNVSSASNDSCFNRMFNGFWFIDGDHSGTNNGTGNPPPADADPGGYMLMVNADYVASEVYRQDISGLCPNTYYEFSAWVRNICPLCGVDSVGTQTYKPGVNPNLTFILDDVDRYSTGEVDTAGGWIKKGFVFITGPSQTSATFSIRNNGQGGGGNDWVMDDISVATCLPNMKYSPSLAPTVCENNALTINDTISSYFNNYRYHQWQRSSDNGVTWTDVSAVIDSTPHFDASTNSWQYITSYTIPPSNTNTADSGNLYRVIVATSAANVGTTSCQVTDGISIINLSVLDCTPVLTTNLLSFNAVLADDRSQLSWTTSKEEKRVKFNVERSYDGSNFIVIGTVNGRLDPSSTTNSYSFTDPTKFTGKAYYRIVMIDEDNKQKLTRIILLTKDMFAAPLLTTVINPFYQQLDFDMNAQQDTKVQGELIDMFGKVVRRASFMVHRGINTLSMQHTDLLPAGAYVFRVSANGVNFSKKVLKRNNP